MQPSDPGLKVTILLPHAWEPQICHGSVLQEDPRAKMTSASCNLPKQGCTMISARCDYCDWGFAGEECESGAELSEQAMLARTTSALTASTDGSALLDLHACAKVSAVLPASRLAAACIWCHLRTLLLDCVRIMCMPLGLAYINSCGLVPATG